MAKRRRSFPRWLHDALAWFPDYVHEEARLLSLSTTGLQQLAASDTLAEALFQLDHPDADEAPARERQRLDAARDTAALARHEVENEFPLLHAHSVVALWGALEASAEDLVIDWLLHHPSKLRTSEAWAQVRVPVSEFLLLSRRERMETLVSEQARKIGTDRRMGVDRVECLLDPIGFSGPVDRDLRRGVFEMQQVRNVLVHRGGLADRRLVERCPWLNLRVGQPVRVEPDDYGRYLDVLTQYWVLVINRFRSAYGYRPFDGNYHEIDTLQVVGKPNPRRSRPPRRFPSELAPPKDDDAPPTS